MTSTMAPVEAAQFTNDETRPTVPGMVDHYIAIDRAKFPHLQPQAWRASSIGYCQARQFLERSGVPHPRDLDAKTLRVFALGDAVHYWVKNLYRRAGILIQEEVAFFDEDWGVSGHMDLLVGGPVQGLTSEETEGRSERWVEFLGNLRGEVEQKWGKDVPVSALELKSAGTYAMQQAFKNGPQPAHMRQIATYYLLAQRNPDQLPVPFDDVSSWEVVMIGKEKLGMLQFPLEGKHIEETAGIIESLNEAWKTQTIPTCTCGQGFSSLPRKYCAYYDESTQLCCSPSLLEGSTK